jgi:ectoine hydroxylase-related dioxygenase (phytanoyl-CoA dioxygenase family)
LLGTDCWTMPRHWGQLMVTFPGAGTSWRLPHRPWHADFEFTAPIDRLFALKLFVFFGEVVPRGGGTLLIERSHRLVARFVEGLSLDDRANYRRTRLRFLSHDPWLKALANPDHDDPERPARFMDHDAEIDGIRTRVIELTGAPGDVVITHPWVFHCPSSNSSAQPRFMRGQAIRQRAIARRERPAETAVATLRTIR